jgi:nicotinamide riboside kinase
MKIAVIGTHFSGKTKLVKELYDILKKRYKRVTKIEEISRKCPHPVNEKTTFEAQLWIIVEHIKREMESLKYDVVISDRSVVDNYIYMMRRFPGKAKRVLPLVLEHAKTYDFIFKTVPRETKIESDGFRSTNSKFRTEIENLLLDFIDTHKITVYTLPEKNLAKYVLEVISNVKTDQENNS